MRPLRRIALICFLFIQPSLCIPTSGSTSGSKRPASPNVKNPAPKKPTTANADERWQMNKHEASFKATYDQFAVDSPFLPGTYANALKRAKSYYNWMIASGVKSTKSKNPDTDAEYCTSVLVAVTYYPKVGWGASSGPLGDWRRTITDDAPKLRKALGTASNNPHAEDASCKIVEVEAAKKQLEAGASTDKYPDGTVSATYGTYGSQWNDETCESLKAGEEAKELAPCSDLTLPSARNPTCAQVATMLNVKNIFTH
ncbi:hypothetical protein B0O99DRAFT_601399 [Bisporella sp. PMI_857]|nr:hypothetical protein B0O99DRAFT_601399 [Bisporella sp. PMI_857]